MILANVIHYVFVYRDLQKGKPQTGRVKSLNIMYFMKYEPICQNFISQNLQPAKEYSRHQ